MHTRTHPYISILAEEVVVIWGHLDICAWVSLFSQHQETGTNEPIQYLRKREIKLLAKETASSL